MLQRHYMRGKHPTAQLLSFPLELARRPRPNPEKTGEIIILPVIRYEYIVESNFEMLAQKINAPY